MTVPTPNPTWKAGDKIKAPFERMIELDPTTLSTAQVYKLLIGSIVPRPIAFVSTASNDGKGNLAPFSFFNGVSSKPPCLVISVSRKQDGSKKDTLLNIEQTSEFVVNSANEWLLEALVHCGAEYPNGVDEMQIVGLTPIPSVKLRVPRVKECAIQFECKVHNIVEIGDGGAGSSSLVIGEIVMLHIADICYADGKVLSESLKPIARIGGFKYTSLGQIYEIPLPKSV